MNNASTTAIQRMPQGTSWLRIASSMVPGLALCFGLAVAAMALGKFPWLAAHGFSALTVAIVLGMLVGNTVYTSLDSASGAGVTFSKQKLLRAGVVLYGLKLTLQDIAHVGIAGVVIDALVLCSTFGMAWLLGTRVFKMDRETAMLVGAGSAICGAAAVMATEPVLKARAAKVTVAVSTVVVFGTLAIFIYPLLNTLNQYWGFVPHGADEFGIYIGSTVHEVAQVVAAARSVGEHAADTAVIAKMVRVMMLAPFLIALSTWLSREERRKAGATGQASRSKLTIPWFAFMFLGVVVINSLVSLPKAVVRDANYVDTLFLAMAMGALGLTTHISSIRQAGVKPLLLAAVLFAWLMAGGAAINSIVNGLLR